MAAITAAATATAAFAPVASGAASITAAAAAAASFIAGQILHDAMTEAAAAAAAFTAQEILTGAFTGAGTAAATFVAGAYRQITVGPSEPVGESAAPTFIGFDPSMQLSIGGIDLKDYHQEEYAQIQSQTIGRWTATIQLFDKTGTVATLFAGANGGVGLSIIIQEYGNKLFAGCIQSVVASRYLGTTAGIAFAITATDKSSILDRRIVKKVVYPGSADGADVVRDVIQNYADGEGITTVNVPATLGELGTDLPINYQSVTSVLNSIATLTATVWWVDVNGDLHFSALADLPAAPFDLTETSYNWRGGTGSIAGGAAGQSLGLSVTNTLQDFATEVIVVSNRNVVPGTGGGSGAQTQETYTIPQARAFDAGLATGYIITQLNIAAVVLLKVNGVQKPTYALDDPAAPPYGSVDAWYIQASGAQVVFPVIAPSPGDVVEVTYVPASSNAAVTEGDALAPVNPALGQCGSGRYQVVVQVQDITTRSDLDAIAAAYLAKLGGVPTQIDYETDYPGLMPGMLQNVHIPLIGISHTDFLITSVSGQSLGSDLGHSGTFRWQVSMRNNQDPGNWVGWMQRLIRRTEQPKPISQLEVHTFIAGAGSSVSGGASITNPVPIQESGLFYRMTVACGQAPVDQDLELTFTLDNIPVGSITLLANESTNFQVVEFFDTSKPVYCYTDQVLNINAAYTNLGASPVAARNVTAIISHVI